MIQWYDAKLMNATRNAVKVATKDGAEIVAADARRRVPVKSGALRQSIKVKESGFKDGGHLVEAYGSPNKFYATFVELGTHKAPAQPFLRPALKANQNRIVRSFSGKLK